MAAATVAAAQSWLAAAEAGGGEVWLANGACEVSHIDCDGYRCPVTAVSRSQPDHSYVVSLPSAWLRYAHVEAERRWPKWQSALLAPCMPPLLGWLQLAGLNRAAIVNNWLVSTNLHPDWTDAGLEQMTKALVQRFPEQPLAMRSVCAGANPALPAQLQALGWQLIPARMVYLCDPSRPTVAKLYNVKLDRKLLNDGQLVYVPPGDILASDLATLRAQFQDLFLNKYARLNPDFSPALFELCHQQGWLELHGFRLNGQMLGFLGLMQSERWLTLPMLGYASDQPQALGLYRRLMALAHELARQRGLGLHMSSGVGPFKRSRGGVAALEYTAVYGQHLSLPRRLALAGFTRVLQNAAPGVLAAAEA
jgi:hypothetical protein